MRTTPLEYRQTVVRADRYSVLAEWSPQGYTVAAEPFDGRAQVAEAPEPA